MKKSELNRIIKDKILDEIEETDELKAFLLEVLDNEVKGMDEGVKLRYSDKYIEYAEKFSQKEMG